MGNVRFIFTVGEPIMCEFTFYGKQSTYSDTALFSPTYPAEKPLIFQNATVTILGDTLILNTLELDMQNTVSMLPKPSDSTGISYGQIVNRDPVITFDPDLELKATPRTTISGATNTGRTNSKHNNNHNNIKHFNNKHSKMLIEQS